MEGVKSDIHEVFSSFFRDNEMVRKIAHELSVQLEKGKTCIDRSNLPLDSSNLIGSSAEDNTPFIATAKHFYLQKYYRYEHYICQRLHQMAKQGDLQIEDGIEKIKNLGDNWESLVKNAQEKGASEQLLAGLNCFLEQFSLVSGGPGTGKTTGIKLFLYLLWGCEPNSSVLLMAPTGKAAARMADSLSSPFFLDAQNSNEFSEYIENIKISTIHRALPSHGKNEVLPYDVVVVDEASMVDISLMAKLLNNIKETARFVLMGDPNQLSSIEAGSVFADILNIYSSANPIFQEKKSELYSGLQSEHIAYSTSDSFIGKAVHLTKSHRFNDSSGIGKISEDVLNGALRELTCYAASNDLTFKDPWDSDQTPPFLDTFQQALGKEKPLEALIDLQQLRILCATRRGQSGVESINGSLLRELTATSTVQVANGIASNVPILIRQNNYDLELYNGDQGLIRRNAAGEMSAYFLTKDNELRTIPIALLPGYDIAFAITIHQSQGSEFERIAILLPQKGAQEILTKQLLYTALTRAKKEIQIYSTEDAINVAVGATAQKATGLAELIEDLYGS